MERDSLTRRNFLAAAGAVGLALTAPPLFAAKGANYSKAVLAKKPVGYWRLGEDKGTEAADGSGHNRKGAYHGPVALQEKGAITGDANTAVKFDGKKSYVEVP